MIWPRDFRKRLMLLVAIIVAVSGLSISQIVTRRYSASLFQAIMERAENVAHDCALDVSDISIADDLPTMRKILYLHMQVDPNIIYIFLINNGRVVAHTFGQNAPDQLINANTVLNHHQGHPKNMKSDRWGRFLDIAWPIADGKGSVLRLGFSEHEIRENIMFLWIQMGTVTLFVLLLSMVITFFILRRITQPLVRLTQAVEKIDEGKMDVQIEIDSPDEIGRLGASFQKMLERVGNYTSRLSEYADRIDEKNNQLALAHRRTRASFEIASGISALPNLKAVCGFLTDKLLKVVKCNNVVFVAFSSKKSDLFIHAKNDLIAKKGEIVEDMRTFLDGLQEMKTVDKTQIPFVLNELKTAEKVAIFPLRIENALYGAMYIGCPGDCDCISSELDMIELVLNQSIGAILRAVQYEDEIRDLKYHIEDDADFNGIIGKDPQMQVIFKLIEDVAPSDATVLIEGESGTGKEMVANAIHKKSLRKDKQFIVINCSAYPASLLESELFGHEKGAFTGALIQKPGRFEQADGGTVFLDEIGEIPPSAQIKLLRVLQSKKFERLGGRETLKMDVRIIAATNKDLLTEVKMRHFREDLFYRLNVIPISLPPLRDRRNDIPRLTRHFLTRFAAIQDKTVKDFTPEAMRRLLDHSWPGNVRELENTVEHAVVLARGEKINVSELPSIFLKENVSHPKNFGKSLQETERQHLIDVLERSNWNKKMAAKFLGIGRSTLYVKLNKYQIKDPTYH